MRSSIFLTNLCIILCVCINELHAAGGGFDWAFNGATHGPSTWTKNYPQCGGARQSPINIETRKTQFDAALKPFILTKNESTHSNYTLTNSGLNFDISMGTTEWTASFAGSSECFRLLQIHFHWGSVDSRGAEHTINGKEFPIEAHYVMWNCLLYSDSATAFSGINGLAVMAVLYQVDNSATTNSAFQSIVTSLGNPSIRKCPCANTSDVASVTIPYFDVNAMLPTKRSKFYRYAGSLTTPPCTENVMWSVYQEPMFITHTQISAFRNLLNRDTNNGGKTNMVDNSRPPLPLNSDSPVSSLRYVSASFRAGSAAVISNVGVLMSLLVIAILNLNIRSC